LPSENRLRGKSGDLVFDAGSCGGGGVCDGSENGVVRLAQWVLAGLAFAWVVESAACIYGVDCPPGENDSQMYWQWASGDSYIGSDPNDVCAHAYAYRNHTAAPEKQINCVLPGERCHCEYRWPGYAWSTDGDAVLAGMCAVGEHYESGTGCVGDAPPEPSCAEGEHYNSEWPGCVWDSCSGSDATEWGPGITPVGTSVCWKGCGYDATHNGQGPQGEETAFRPNGSTCVPNNGPGPADGAKGASEPNQICDANGTYCWDFNRNDPNCGTFNGQPVCVDHVPPGECYILANVGVVCASGDKDRPPSSPPAPGDAAGGYPPDVTVDHDGGETDFWGPEKVGQDDDEPFDSGRQDNIGERGSGDSLNPGGMRDDVEYDTDGDGEADARDTDGDGVPDEKIYKAGQPGTFPDKSQEVAEAWTALQDKMDQITAEAQAAWGSNLSGSPALPCWTFTALGHNYQVCLDDASEFWDVLATVILWASIFLAFLIILG